MNVSSAGWGSSRGPSLCSPPLVSSRRVRRVCRCLTCGFGRCEHFDLPHHSPLECVYNKFDRRQNGHANDPSVRDHTPLYIFQLEDALKEQLSNSSPDPETRVHTGRPSADNASTPSTVRRSVRQATSPSGSNSIPSPLGEEPSSGRRPVSHWHPEEDLELIRCRGQGLPYAKISEKFPKRSEKACQNRYLRLVETNDTPNVVGLSRAYQDSRERIWSILADQVGVNWQALESLVRYFGYQLQVAYTA
jgi:hypothetical protein